MTRARSLLALLALFGGAACHPGGGGGGIPPGGGAPTSNVVDPGEDAPAIVVTIEGLAGASGSDGSFRPGDRLTVVFALEQADGTDWGLAEMDSALALVSGPTFRYQRVLPAEEDLIARAVSRGNGRYKFTFAAPLPSTYAPPLNDSTTFDADDGELAGQALLAGTYTLGLSFSWDFTVAGDSFTTYLQVGEATADFLLGSGAGALSPRAVVSQANCERCHVDLRAHAGRHRDLGLCLLCHTAGAEDLNDPAIEGGTPGASVDSRVLFHKLHNGQHLPSVLGIAIDDAGQRDYTAPARPYRLVAADGTVLDYSAVGFPVFPYRSQGMPHDLLYSIFLTDEQRALEDATTTGVASCASCHGDPDGGGPLAMPAQGGLIYAQPSRAACSACHDDIDWTKPYDVNGRYMPPDQPDSECTECHVASTSQPDLDVRNAHRHPLDDEAFTPGLALFVDGVSEAGASDGDGTLDAGEKLRLTLRLEGEDGLSVDPATLAGLHATLAGPSWNLNLVHDDEVPLGLLAGAQPFEVLLPMRRTLEFLGDATAAPGDMGDTRFAPHLDLAGAPTRVRVRTGPAGAASALAAAAPAQQNFVDVADASAFARDDVVVLDDGVPGLEEYRTVQYVDGDRLWFSAPNQPAYPTGVENAHAAGAVVLAVQLADATRDVDWALDPATGTITELVEFGAGNAVLVDYWTDFVVPAAHAQPPNGSPDLGERAGEWSAKPLVDGTHRVSLSAWTFRDWIYVFEPTTYRVAASAAAEFLVGDAVASEPYDLIDDAERCNACHQALEFHGGRDRGFAACVTCHGTAGAEDRPRYVAANAPETLGTPVSFRSLVHKIHMGRLLSNPSAYVVVGDGPAAYPDNFSTSTWEDLLFPAQPGAASRCAKCHGGDDEVWKVPAPREHPDGQSEPTRVWVAVCGACHDSLANQAHFNATTSPAGIESCLDCHGPGEMWAVELVHKTR
jgi:hypothetical protein